MSMFCYQCEQTFRGSGCVVTGMCGKDPISAAMQDLIIYSLQELAREAWPLRQHAALDPEVDRFTTLALFSTLTNVNFDPQRLAEIARRAATLRDALAAERKDGDQTASGKRWQPADSLAGLIAQSQEVGAAARQRELGADIAGLQELLLGGLKGIAAYAHHAAELDQADPQIGAFLHEALASLSQARDAETLLGLCLRAGAINLRALELLEQANTEAYGHPQPTAVRTTPRAGKAILISGHDLKDLAALLEQTAGLGINIYTHGEMLPAHGYPELKRHAHLAGNLGGAWWEQRMEFSRFPGAILMTTNCLQRPEEIYKDRLFTAGPVAWPGVRHIQGRDFAPLIEAALTAPGFAADEPGPELTVGFGRQAVLGVADKVVQAVKDGAIRHFYLIGGCDGPSPARQSFGELAGAVPEDCLILTLGCGKYRFHKRDFGTVAGLPRLLDLGQCNDAYAAIQIAAALAQAFDTDLNSLPLSLILSWYEQKAVAILLTLLHLGVKNIRLGPTLPAFLTPAVLEVLVDKFQLKPTGTPAQDLQPAAAAASSAA